VIFKVQGKTQIVKLSFTFILFFSSVGPQIQNIQDNAVTPPKNQQLPPNQQSMSAAAKKLQKESCARKQRSTTTTTETST
jgi:hypothetical protein